ncbi:hypothetical protein NDU88_003979 [Pleurodeles waltl]|uniref:Uncharacterized protein n=1 Tax=Pleurodeles waltl TaxID=8319 RepID=A0AAV7V3Y2_PLEWA|nr:hypothetical protein NDU88_003979 [Pleurodeles waltl]
MPGGVGVQWRLSDGAPFGGEWTSRLLGSPSPSGIIWIARIRGWRPGRACLWQGLTLVDSVGPVGRAECLAADGIKAMTILRREGPRLSGWTPTSLHLAFYDCGQWRVRSLSERP